MRHRGSSIGPMRDLGEDLGLCVTAMQPGHALSVARRSGPAEVINGMPAAGGCRAQIDRYMSRVYLGGTGRARAAARWVARAAESVERNSLLMFWSRGITDRDRFVFKSPAVRGSRRAL